MPILPPLFSSSYLSIHLFILLFFFLQNDIYLMDSVNLFLLVRSSIIPVNWPIYLVINFAFVDF